MPATPTVPTTLLQAVNEMLKAVGKVEVMSLDAIDDNAEAQSALNTLGQCAVSVQERGWHFNTDENYPMNPASDGTIPLPSNTAKVAVGQRSRFRFLTQRAGKVYDLKNHTFNWTATATPPSPEPLLNGVLYVDIVFLFDFEDCPQAIRWLIMATAGQQWGVGKVPDMATYKFSDVVLQKAEADAQQADLDSRALAPEENPHFRAMRRR